MGVLLVLLLLLVLVTGVKQSQLLVPDRSLDLGLEFDKIFGIRNILGTQILSERILWFPIKFHVKKINGKQDRMVNSLGRENRTRAQRLFCNEGRLSMKGVFHLRLSSIEGRLPSKVVFH